MATKLAPVKIEGVRLLFRNFAGLPDKFNKDGGKRYFNAILPPELADQMIKDGWNIKTLRSRDEDEPDQPHIKVNVNFKGRQPPRLVLITKGGAARTNFPVSTPEEQEYVAIFDMVDVAFADLIINPYQRDPDSPVTAYLKTLFVTVHEDDLEKKYADVPELEYNKPMEIEGVNNAGEIEADPMMEGEVLEDDWDDR